MARVLPLLAAGKGLQIHLHPLGDVLPELDKIRSYRASVPVLCLPFSAVVFTARARDGKPSLGRKPPDAVVIGPKLLPQLVQFRRGRPVIQIIAINFFGGKLFEFSPEGLKQRALGLLPGGGRRGNIQIGDHSLHRHITGQIPQLRIQQGIHKLVPENTMEHHVQIIPHRALFFAAVGLEHMAGGIVNMGSVGGQRTIRRFQRKLAEGRVQKTQVHQKGIAGQIQDFPGQLIQFLLLFSLFGHCATSCSVA